MEHSACLYELVVISVRTTNKSNRDTLCECPVPLDKISCVYSCIPIFIYGEGTVVIVIVNTYCWHHNQHKNPWLLVINSTLYTCSNSNKLDTQTSTMSPRLPEPNLKATAATGSLWVATYAFESQYDEDLPMEPGDIVKIVEYVGFLRMSTKREVDVWHYISCV